ncbi:anti sigma factor C-terminal domain-containing protein [Sellimonas sp.]|uniref:anti sigma factor C-terminal domain-containing protein n=1 Tax=Sellimonas sp. TaxID=2021466 RepID=UPI00257D7307|nr:anti sigma factor C-terminal domain-containing protein [Sellimonas sp.]
MNYEELLKKYRQGQTTEEETRRIEEDIEKFEAISVYLEETLEEERTGLEIEEADAKDIRRIKGKVNRKVFFYSFSGAAVLIAIILLINLICSQIFYNPNKGIREIYGGDGQLMLDLSVYTEMHNPGYIVNQAHAEPDWFGKYGLSVTWGRLFTGEEEKAYINLVRGKVKESGNVERSFKGTSIYHAIGTKLGMVIYEGKDDTSMDLAKAELQNQQEHIAALPESAYLAVNITFPEAKTVEEMLKFADQYQGVSIIYNYVESKTGALQMNGFGFERAGIIPDQTEEINQKYPYLWTLGEDMDSGDRAEKWTLHYESMLKYLSERGEFIDMMTDAVSGWSSVDYKEELETVKKEGIHIVGMQIHGKRQDILDIIASGEIDGMDILDVKVSEYSR